MDRRWKQAVVAGLILAEGSTQARAWKVRAYVVIRTVHGKQSDRAVEMLVRYQTPHNSSEWIRFQGLLESSCGNLENDSNSHGNLLWPTERLDPLGQQPQFESPMAFNGGPFYRWFVRAVEAGGRLNTGVPVLPGSMGVWRRDPRPFAARNVYRYLGHMAHLVQDSCAPAHVANIRHGPWDGVEWWHWDRASLGGEGRNEPLAADVLVGRMGEVGGWDRGNFQTYWKNDLDLRNRRDVKNENKHYTITKAFLFDIIKANQDRIMPGLAAALDPRSSPYLRTFAEGGRTLGKVDATLTWKDEVKRHPVFSEPIYDRNGDQVDWKNKIEVNDIPLKSIDPLRQLISNCPQYPGANLTENFLTISGIAVPLDNSLSMRWKELNRGRTPWLPNPKYEGEQFDSRWGSYGGHWGFPGQTPIEGDDPAPDVLTDALTGGLGRISPGDLYVVHSTPSYNDQKLEGEVPSTVVHQGDPGYQDERTLLPTTVNRAIGSAMEQVGNDQIDRSAMNTAVLYENFSKVFPPVIDGFTVIPRRPDPSMTQDFPNKPLPWTSGISGAVIDLRLQVNRRDEYRLEFYAIPRDQFKEATTWKRQLQFQEHVLSESDVGVVDSVAPHRPSWVRNFDYAYGRLMGYPLRLVRGIQNDLSTFNLLQTGENELLPREIHITQQMLEANPNPGGWEDYLSQYFSSSFTWSGEVEEPVSLFPSPDGTTPANPLPPPLRIREKKVLASGDYFILVMAYHKGARDGFARNQFKFLTQGKDLLECMNWNTTGWTDKTIKPLLDPARRPVARTIIIPDELAPIRVDSDLPKILQ